MKIIRGKELENYYKKTDPANAGLAPNITVNIDLVNKYISNFPKKNKNNILSRICIIGLLIGSIISFYEGAWIWGIILLIAFLVSLFLSSIFHSIPLDTYKNGMLIPGIISSVNPITVTSLAKLAITTDSPVAYGCKQYQIKELPLHSIQVGEYIPCAANLELGEESKPNYESYSFYPLSWATERKDEMESESKRIKKEDWILLKEIMKDMQTNNINLSEHQILYFDREGTFIKMHQEKKI